MTCLGIVPKNKVVVVVFRRKRTCVSGVNNMVKTHTIFCCPYCRGNGKLYSRNTSGSASRRTMAHYVTCNSCFMRGPIKYSPESAVEAWNGFLEPTHVPFKEDGAV